jgi:hypothetical protein
VKPILGLGLGGEEIWGTPSGWSNFTLGIATWCSSMTSWDCWLETGFGVLSPSGMTTRTSKTDLAPCPVSSTRFVDEPQKDTLLKYKKKRVDREDYGLIRGDLRGP